MRAQIGCKVGPKLCECHPLASPGPKGVSSFDLGPIFVHTPIHSTLQKRSEPEQTQGRDDDSDGKSQKWASLVLPPRKVIQHLTALCVSSGREAREDGSEAEASMQSQGLFARQQPPMSKQGPSKYENHGRVQFCRTMKLRLTSIINFKDNSHFNPCQRCLQGSVPSRLEPDVII